MLSALRSSICCASRPRSRSAPQGKPPDANLAAVKEALKNAKEGIDDPNAPPQVRLLRAGTSGNVKIIQAYFNEGTVDVHRVMNKQEDTILHHAATAGQVAVVQLLVSTFKGTRDDQISWINQRNSAHETALFLACGEGHLDVVKLLLEAGADVNLANFYGETPLYLAAYWGKVAVVDHLLHGLDNPPVLRANADGTTPSGIAAVRGHREISKMIDQYVKDRLSTGNSRVFGAWGLGTVTVKSVPYVSANLIGEEVDAIPTVGQLQARLSASIGTGAGAGGGSSAAALPVSASSSPEIGSREKRSSSGGLKTNVHLQDAHPHSL